MANWNKLTERQFKAVKLLLNGGATQKEAAEYMQVSPNTAFWIGKAENYEEYLQIKAEKLLDEKKRVAAIKAKEAAKVAEKVGAVPAATLTAETPATQVVEHRQTVTIQATHYMMTEMQKTNELLAAISRKLAFIVDELCGTAGKKEG